MGADSAVEMGTNIAIVALYLNGVGVAEFDDVAVHRHAASSTSIPKSFSVFCTPAPYVPNGQKENFAFSAARACAAIMVVDFLLQFLVIYTLTAA